MSDEQTTTAMAVAVLRDAYPRQEFPDASVRMYVRMLGDLDPAFVAGAVRRLIRRSAWLPSIAEIRLEVAEEIHPLPTPAEAWTLACFPQHSGLPSPQLHAEVRASLDAVGGRWAVTHSERPETIRAQFLRDYEQRRTTAMLEAAEARAPRPTLTRAEQAFGTLDALPVSEAIRPRPVYARWLRRQELSGATDAPGIFRANVSLVPPTPEEKHDAILVLRDWCAMTGDDLIGEPETLMVIEAQRIMDEASAT